MRFLIYLFLVVMGGFAHAQNKELLYDVTELPQSLMLNPGAAVEFDYHAGVPALSQVHVNIGFRGLSLYDLFADDRRNFNTKIGETLNKLTSNDYLTFTQQLELVNFGWRSTKDPDMYFSGGVYQELDFITYFPKDIATLIYRGNSGFLGRPFKLSHIASAGELLSVYHFGYNKRMSKTFTFGARAKLYSSIFNFRSVRNRGTFTTAESPDGPNIFRHSIRNVDIGVRTAGYASLREIESEDTADGAKQVQKKFVNRALLGGNLGLGVDLGFTYQPEDQWLITASATDLGMIFYTKDVENYRVRGNFVYDGLQINNQEEQDVLEEVKAALPVDTLNTSYAALRPLKLNASIRHSFNRYKSGTCKYCYDGEDPPYLDAVGVQLFTQFRPKRPQLALSFFYYKRWFNFLKTKINYTIDDYSYKNLGLLVSTHFNKINFYVSANNLLEYSNLARARGAALQFGFNIIK